MSHDFRLYSVIIVLGTTASAVFVICGIMVGGALEATIGATFGQLATTLGVGFGANRLAKRSNVRVNLAFEKTHFKEALSVGLPFFVAVLFLAPVELTCQALLVRLHGVEALGDYRVVLAATSILSFVPAALAAPMSSYFAQTDANSSDRTFQVAFTTTKFIWFGTLLVVFGVLAVWPEFIQMLFGDEYSAAATFGLIALGSTLLIVTSGPASNLLLVQKRSKVILLISGVQSAVWLISAIFLIPGYGLIGYWTSSLFGSFSMFLSYVVVLIAYAKARKSDIRRIFAIFSISTIANINIILFSIMQISITSRLMIASIDGFIVFLIFRWIILSQHELEGMELMVKASFRRLWPGRQ